MTPFFDEWRSGRVKKVGNVCNDTKKELFYQKRGIIDDYASLICFCKNYV